MNDAEPTCRRDWMWLLALLALVLALNLAWHATHATPFVDGHRTLIQAVNQFESLLAAPLNHFALLLTDTYEQHLFSLFNASAVTTVAIFGWTQLGVLFISTLYLLLLIASVYGIVRRLQPGPGALAAAVASLFPAAVMWSRIFSSYTAEMAVAAFGVYLLVRSEWFSRPLPALAFGALASVSFRLSETIGDGLQLEMVFFCTALFTFAFGLWRPVRTRWHVLLIAAGTVVIAALAVNRPYLRNLLVYTQQETVSFSDTRYAGGNLGLSPLAIIAYPVVIFDHHLGAVLSLATLAALVFLARRPDRAVGLGVFFFVVPLCVASFVSKKNFNYVLALLPGAAVLIGLAVGRLGNLRIARLVTAALLVSVVAGAVWPAFRTLNPNSNPHPPEPPWYGRFFQTVADDINPPIDETFYPGEVVRGLAELPQRPGGVRVLVIGQTHAHTHITAFRFLLRLAATHRNITILDPFNQLIEFCEGLPREAPELAACPDPDVIVVFPSTPEMLDYVAYASDTAQWQRTFGKRQGCSDPAGEAAQQMAQTSARWTACLADLPWDQYRARIFPATTNPGYFGRGVILDRPDRGVAVTLPPLPKLPPIPEHLKTPPLLTP